MVGTEGHEARALRPHHDQRQAGLDPVPAALHPHCLESGPRLGVQQDMVGEVDPVVVVQLRLGDRHIGSADLAGGAAEPDPGHIADRRLLAPSRVGYPEADVDRCAASRAGRSPVIAVGHPAVRAGVGSRAWHGHGDPYSEPWWTYMDWMPTRPGPVISARYILCPPMSPVLTFCLTAFMVTDESL